MDCFLDRHVRTIQTNNLRRRTGSPIPHPDTAATGSAHKLERRSDSGRSRDPAASKDQAANSGHSAVGPDSELGQRSKNRIQDHQCEGGDSRYGTVISASVHETALSNSGRLVSTSGRKSPAAKFPTRLA
jgi:hypothetical protein